MTFEHEHQNVKVYQGLWDKYMRLCKGLPVFRTTTKKTTIFCKKPLFSSFYRRFRRFVVFSSFSLVSVV